MSTVKRLAEIRASISFNKCFRDDESKALVKALKQEEGEITMELKSKEMSIRLKFQEVLIKEGYSYEECAEMSLVELRNCVDEVQPLVIVNSGLTMRGGKTKKVTVIRKAA